jgi:hypothetical protein
MLENLSGAVAFALYEDRLVRAVMDDRIAEAEAARKAARVNPSHRRWRQIAAHALIALATRLAPTVQTSPTPANA